MYAGAVDIVTRSRHFIFLPETPESSSERSTHLWKACTFVLYVVLLHQQPLRKPGSLAKTCRASWTATRSELGVVRWFSNRNCVERLDGNGAFCALAADFGRSCGDELGVKCWRQGLNFELDQQGWTRDLACDGGRCVEDKSDRIGKLCAAD